jgi:hypothetical protein
VNLIGIASAVVATRPDNHNVAASNETKSVLKQLDMFLNCRSLPIIWRETLEIDFYWCLHNLLLKPNLAQASPSRLKNEEPP